MRTGQILMLFFAATWLSCQHDIPTDRHEASHRHESKILSLNDGAKWKTDAGTRMHAENLIELSRSFGIPTELSAYHEQAKALQTELDVLLKECRMIGPEHEALHHWLEPVMDDVHALSQQSDVAKSRQVAQKLNQDLQKFNQYFY